MVHKKRIYTCQIPQPLQNEETTLKPKNWKVIYHESSYHLYYTFIPKLLRFYERHYKKVLHFQRLLKLKLKVDTSI